MAFINTWNLPAGAYQVFVAETNWKSRPYTGLDDTVRELKAHRVANPRFGWPTDDANIRQWVLNYTEQRLRAMPGGAGMGWLVPDSPPPDASFQVPSRQRQPGLAQHGPAAGPAAKAVAGIGLLADWLGSGLKPVEQSLADKRASVCVKCVLNVKHTGLTNILADGLHLLMDAKAQMKLTTPHDAMLETCTACNCRNSLKVWTPIEHIKAHTTPEIFAALDLACWIRAETAVSD